MKIQITLIPSNGEIIPAEVDDILYLLEDFVLNAEVIKSSDDLLSFTLSDEQVCQSIELRRKEEDK